MDKLTRERRSENMRRIRSANTKPEIAVRRLVHSLGFRFRLHLRDLPGRPDIVLPKHRAIILVHGCFWHQHRRCIDGRQPQSNTSYWSSKLERNLKRDRSNARKLRRLGWRVLTIWECQLGRADLHARITKFLDAKWPR